MGIKIKNYEYFISNKPNKKLFAIVDGKEVHFGDSRYQHYKDKTGLLPKSENHLDEKRKTSYIARASKIKDKSGALTANNPSSPNYHALRILWDY